VPVQFLIFHSHSRLDLQINVSESLIRVPSVLLGRARGLLLQQCAKKLSMLLRPKPSAFCIKLKLKRRFKARTSKFWDLDNCCCQWLTTNINMYLYSLNFRDNGHVLASGSRHISRKKEQ